MCSGSPITFANVFMLVGALCILCLLGALRFSVGENPG
jgi:hypothetical protein